MEGTEKANLGWSSVYKGINNEKTIFEINNKQMPISWNHTRIRLTRLQSIYWNNNSINSSHISNHSPFARFLLYHKHWRTPRAKGLNNISLLSCSLTNLCKASNFSCFRGHCSIHTGWSVFQLRGMGVSGGRLIREVATSEKEVVWNLE